MKTFRRTHRKLQKLQRGQAIVIIALAMIGIMAFAVLAIDGGRFYDQRRVSQNASDMSAMAGAFKYVSDATVQESAVLAEVNRIAELNYIPDTDGVTANAINANVKAWWVNSDGTAASGDWTTSEITGSTETAPTNTAGVKVQTKITYRTFMGGIIGQAVLTVQTDSIAKQTVSYLGPFTNPNLGSMYVGGSDCDNLTNKIAHVYADTNSAKFMSKVFVNGTLATGDVNSADFYADFKVRVATGDGNSDIPLLSSVTDIGSNDPFDNPYTSNSNTFHSGSYIPPESPVAAAEDWPLNMYVGADVDNGLVDAEAFRPTTGYFWKVWKAAKGETGPEGVNNRWHYFPGNADPTVTGTAVHDAFIDDKRGVYFVDGDLTMVDREDYTDITLIVNGRFDNLPTGSDFYTATPGNLVGNISLLAGGDRGTAANDHAERCASDKTQWVLHARGNNTQFHGIVWVPYGQIYFEGNTAGGTGQFSDGIVAYSVRLGSDDASANSWQFNFEPSKFVMPVISNGLVN